MSCNGYANFETWNTVLWLRNDEGLFNECARIVRHARTSHDAADALEEMVTEAMPHVPVSLYSDLLNHALGQVDWKEVAEAFDNGDEADGDEEEEEEGEWEEEEAMLCLP